MKNKYKIQEGEEENIRKRLINGETYKNIGISYNVSRERIRQIAKKLNLHGYGITLRRNRQLEDYRSKMKKKYGEFFKDGFIDKSDFMYACKVKFRSKQNSAKQQGIEFTVEFDDIDWVTHCPILGLELNYFPEGSRQENSVSFDRFDPTKGYIKENVYICSWRANRIKNDGTIEEHKKIVAFLLNHMK